MKRTHLFLGLGALLLFSAAILFTRSDSRDRHSPVEGEIASVTMYKSPECGCCDKWSDHAEENGFVVTPKYRGDMSVVKQDLGVPADLSSCHTSVVDGYVVEGHVPASAIAKLLKERPQITGIAVAGMPSGSPGMDSATPQPYNVVAFTAAGQRYIFGRY